MKGYSVFLGAVPQPPPILLFTQTGLETTSQKGYDWIPVDKNTLDVSRTFSEAVQVYLTQADYLTDEDMPMITALVLAAEALDQNGISTRLLSDYGIAYRTLAKRKTTDAGPMDEAESFLADL